MPEHSQLDTLATELNKYNKPEDRQRIRQFYVDQVEAKNPPAQAIIKLREAGDFIGEDFQGLMSTFRGARIDPLSPEKARELFDNASIKVPAWRRAVSKLGAAADWWKKTQIEPGIGLLLAGTFKLMPGEQDFEKKVTAAQSFVAAQRGIELRESGIADFVKAASEAYRQTDTPWGLKGLAELIFDPLNLAGMGLPSKLGNAIPAIRPLLVPLVIIDKVPEAVIKAPFKVTAAIAKRTPGLKTMAQPHFTTRVKESYEKTTQELTSRFGSAKMAEGTIEDTRTLLSGMKSFPEDANVYSLNNLWNHLAESLGESRYLKFEEEIRNLVPKQATQRIAEEVALIERNAIVKGGKTAAGEIFTETLRERRRTSVQGFLERLHFDERNAKGVSEGVDRFIHGTLDNWYTRKIEPMLVRPWSLAYLATAGFPVMNVVESVGISVTGMGGMGKLGWNDVDFAALSTGLRIPTSMMTAQEQMRSFIGQKTGIFNNPSSTPFNTLGNIFGGWFIQASNAVEWPVRRSAFINRYFRDFHKEMVRLGTPTQELDSLKDFIMGEFPDGLDHLREEIAGRVVAMITTGDSSHIRGLGDLVSSGRIIQKAQMDALQQLIDAPPDARRVLQEAILSEGGINATNREFIEEAVRKEMLEHHKFTPAYIEGELLPFVENLKVRKAKSPAEATAVLRMLQHAGDTIAQLPREVRGHYRQLTLNKSAKEKSALWKEADGIITNSLSKVRKAYEEALTTNKADLQLQMDKIIPTAAQQESVRRSIDDIFNAYKSISDNLGNTWEEHLSRRNALFDSTPIEDRDNAFWREIEDMGNEVWTREMEFRADQANLARTGWNAFFDVMPKDVTGRDREFLRDGLLAAVGDAEVRQNELHVLLGDLEDGLESLPTILQPERLNRISQIKTSLQVAANHRTELQNKLTQFGELSKGRIPKRLRDADKTVVQVKAAIKAAEDNGSVEVLPELRKQLTAATKMAEDVFNEYVPALHKREWETLKVARDTLASQAERETLPGAKAAALKQLRVVSANINRFQEAIRKGEAHAQAERITGLKNRVVLQAADQVVNALGGGTPESIDAVEALIIELAQEGNVVANNILNHMQEISTRLAQAKPDIAKPKTQLVHYSSRSKIKETDPEFFGTGANSEEIRSGRVHDEGFRKRTYFYTVDTPPEKAVLGTAGVKYYSELDAAAIYDLNLDPDSFLTRFPDAPQRENAIVDAGFSGFSNGNRIAIFQKLPVHGEVTVGQQKLRVTKKMLKTITDRTKDPEIRGASFTTDGQDVTELAAKGTMGRFAVGAFPEREVVIPIEDFGEAQLKEFIDANTDLLSMDGNFIGAFWDEDGNVYLDVLKAINKRTDAMTLASAREQNSIFDMVSGTVQDTANIPTPFDSTKEEVFGAIYTKALEAADQSPLNQLEFDTLRRTVTEDVRPTAAVVRLVQEGFTTPPVKLRNGEWRLTLTDKGTEALERTPAVTNVDDFIAGLPDPTRNFDSIIDSQMAEVRQVMDDMVKLQENPPLPVGQESKLRSYFNTVADEVDRRPNFSANVRVARKNANETALKEYDDWFINYDQKSTGDWIMQRLMPFWMYESRRWPRLVRLVAKRPVLSKYIAMSMSDTDYGYRPVGGGFEFSPFRGHLLSGVRKTTMRDFPELHSDYRGSIEQGQDWLGRFGFYFNPLISGVGNVLNGEPGQLIPPPISLALHGLVGAGVSIPEPFAQLAFSDKLTNFMLDQVVAEEFKRNPTELRNLAESGDDEAIGILHAAKIIAARKIITASQAGVIRYKPPGKREFLAESTAAVEEVLGFPEDLQKAARRLGLSTYEIVASSAPQRRWMRENLKDFDAWFGASISLKPIEEQDALKKTDAFWFTIEKMREADKIARTEVSDDWIAGKESGPSAISALSELKRLRSSGFDIVHNQPEFKDVPITLEDRIKYLQRFGRPAPLANPVDEALEIYHSLNPEDYIDELSGETNWNAFFSDQESILSQFEPQIQQIVMAELNRSDTDLERMLKVASPFLRQYYGVRDDVLKSFEPQNPVLGTAWREYRRLGNLAKQEVNPLSIRHFERQQWEILARNPQLSLMEKLVTQIRQRMRLENQEMERFYQMFIARPQGVRAPTRRSRKKIEIVF